MPADSNMHGDVFGGWIMSQVDIAGGITAGRRANGRVVTVAVNSFLFKQPVHVGDVVTFYTVVVRVGTTSITVFVEVFAERVSQRGEIIKVTEATLSFVAIGADKRPRTVPPESD
jgi:acyl-CoA thioesterase YciA